LSGDKFGSSGHDIITHTSNNFNPNVRIVVDKKIPKMVLPKDAKSSSDKEYELIEGMKDEENVSGSFIVIAAVVIVFVCISLVVAKTMLKK